jgi:hypothetical protein
VTTSRVSQPPRASAASTIPATRPGEGPDVLVNSIAVVRLGHTWIRTALVSRAAACSQPPGSTGPSPCQGRLKSDPWRRLKTAPLWGCAGEPRGRRRACLVTQVVWFLCAKAATRFAEAAAPRVPGTAPPRRTGARSGSRAGRLACAGSLSASRPWPRRRTRAGAASSSGMPPGGRSERGGSGGRGPLPQPSPGCGSDGPGLGPPCR